jgi:hypothetical protein
MYFKSFQQIMTIDNFTLDKQCFLSSFSANPRRK